VAALVIERNLPPITIDKPFSAKSTETNFKMVAVAAILKIETCRFSKGTSPYITTNTHIHN
jgi:hypothetical protein